MVAWSTDPSYLSGYDPITKKTIQNAYVFATSGSAVNVNAITRVGHGVSALPAGAIPGVRAQIKMVWQAGDGSGSGTTVKRAVQVFVARADAVPEVPTPQQVINGASIIKRSVNTSWVDGLWTYTFDWTVASLSTDTKYWVVVIPVLADTTTTPGKTFTLPIGATMASVARGLSFWTDRSANPPVITSPANGSVIDPGVVFTLGIQPNDPDAMGPDEPPRYNRDLAGLEVQYAPPPTPENPDPEWTLLPYTLASGAEGLGSYAFRTNVASPFYDATMINEMGFPVKAGATKPPAGQAGLPGGTWLLRARTFGFGNPFPETNGVGGAMPPTGPWPSAGATSSGWSETIKVTVPGRVPVPLALSPIKGRAMSFGSPVPLTWRYRNLNIPAMAQMFSRVQVRKATETDWTTVGETFSANPFFAPGPRIAASPNVFVDLCNSATNWTGIAAGAGTTVPTAAGGYVTMKRGANSWPDATKTGPVVLARSGITGITRDAIVTIKGRRLMAENPVPGQPYAITGTFQQGGVDVPSYMISQVGAENTWASTYEPWEMKFFAKGGFTSLRLEQRGQDGLPSELGIDEIRVDLPATGYDFVQSTEYEWRVQVVDSGGEMSGFSQPARFWVVPAVDSGPGMAPPSETLAGATLGCGTHRAFIYRRGGKTRVGEVTGITSLDYARVRDDISTSRIVVANWSIDCGNMLAKLSPWAYEIVIFRNNGHSVDRVWEGPITLLTYEQDSVTIQSKDVIGYLYRRIMRQAMSDKGLRSVVGRATQITQDAFAPDDPNVLAYLNPLTREDDAKSWRDTPEYSRTAFEEIDDMASNSGLDYTALGRSIVFWGTRHRIGTLPEFRDEYFGSPPVVSVYGMSMANRYVVSDGNGIWGAASRGLDPVSGNNEYYGLVEMLSSSWASDEDPIEGTYTEEQRQKVVKSFEESSERSIEDRYPAPVVVRVPDNTTLNPNTPVSFQDLVPGVVIPLRATGTLREVVGSQKLDSVSVTETGGTETITVVMSPFNRDDASMDEGGDV